MRIGVAPHRLWPDQEGELDAVLQIAVSAEELGLDHVFASGHAVAGASGVTPDPLVLLAAIAGATRRIGLVTSVLVLPLYNTLVLAHQTATLDRLSGGPGVWGYPPENAAPSASAPAGTPRSSRP
ncbi:LLM class flavin-dependent oxidoreductase [Streptomyces prunicolor]|jgi:alkanesulfonate monooxygenase SsuD/methylene tetrahydromethanopterin reductase-like flavin-dependent oxidoreductase (luciferase family)|uniref:LLM class flavin-dependent oxidoreductase n=1 Tax=Streptomyces prunicolor TaxID=67348 RepID=UPI0034132ADF